MAKSALDILKTWKPERICQFGYLLPETKDGTDMYGEAQGNRLFSSDGGQYFIEEYGGEMKIKNSELYLYDDHHYKHVTKDDFIKYLHLFLKDYRIPSKRLTSSFVHNVYDYIKDNLEKINVNSEPILNLKNGVFYLESGEFKYFESEGQQPSITDKEVKGFGFNYKLDFDYDPLAECPLFEKFINDIMPRPKEQNLLFESLGYALLPTRVLNLEKMIVYLGTGANGKSVLFNIITALLGKDNITTMTLEEICTSENHRSRLGESILNFSSELGKKISNDNLLKKLASGEPISAKKLYKDTYDMSDYAKMVFNANEIPRDVTDFNDSYIRRFLIVPFKQSIPLKLQDPMLSNKIIKTEMSGVLNYIIKGMKKILDNTKNGNTFTLTEDSEQEINKYLMSYNHVRIFIEDLLEDQETTDNLIKGITTTNLYDIYKDWCKSTGYQSFSRGNFQDRLSKIKGFSEVKPHNIQTIKFKPALYTHSRHELKESETVATDTIGLVATGTKQRTAKTTKQQDQGITKSSLPSVTPKEIEALKKKKLLENKLGDTFEFISSGLSSINELDYSDYLSIRRRLEKLESWEINITPKEKASIKNKSAQLIKITALKVKSGEDSYNKIMSEIPSTTFIGQKDFDSLYERNNNLCRYFLEKAVTQNEVDNIHAKNEEIWKILDSKTRI